MRTLLAVALLAAACGTATSTSTSHNDSGTISGSVFRAPTCPVEKLTSPCPPSHVGGAEVDVVQGSSTVARTTSDPAGSFTVAVAPGSYTVVAYNTGGMRNSARASVVVHAGSTSTITLVVDSGIR